MYGKFNMISKFKIGDKVTPNDKKDAEHKSCMIVVFIGHGNLRKDADSFIHVEPEHGGFVGEYLEEELEYYDTHKT